MSKASSGGVIIPAEGVYNIDSAVSLQVEVLQADISVYNTFSRYIREKDLLSAAYFHFEITYYRLCNYSAPDSVYISLLPAR